LLHGIAVKLPRLPAHYVGGAISLATFLLAGSVRYLSAADVPRVTTTENGRWTMPIGPVVCCRERAMMYFAPTASSESVTESGKPLAKAEGVKFAKIENGRTLCELQSGSYRFESKLEEKPR
jgi:hypothetical protein